jgi:exopolysaccharide biosynthesis polyprenyl glycosylphosphotransferase
LGEKISECRHGYLRVPFDALAGILGWTFSYFFRIQFSFLPGEKFFSLGGGLPQLDFFLLVAITSVALLILIFASLGLYDFPARYFSLDIFGKLLWGIMLWVLAIVAFFSLLLHELIFSRAMLGQTVLATLFFAFFLRVILKNIDRPLRPKKWIIIGTKKEFEHGVQTLQKKEQSHSLWVNPTPIALSLVKNSPDGVIFFEDKNRKELLNNIRELCAEREIPLRIIPQFGIEFWGHASMEVISGIPVISISPTRFSPWGMAGKRLFDIFSCLFIFILASPFLFLISVLILLDSKGGIFYASWRIGKNGVPFRMWKFRSMVYNADEQKVMLKKKSHRDGPFFKIKDDPRVTRIGKFLRRTSLDELPQLWNILRGEMSLIGPRPHLPEEVQEYTPAQRRVLAAVPGITGFAQISGRSDLSFEEEMMLDSYYLENQSFLFDLEIALKTFWVLLHGKGAD